MGWGRKQGSVLSAQVRLKRGSTALPLTASLGAWLGPGSASEAEALKAALTEEPIEHKSRAQCDPSHQLHSSRKPAQQRCKHSTSLIVLPGWNFSILGQKEIVQVK